MKILNKRIKFCVLTCTFAFCLFTFDFTCYASSLDSLKTSLLRGDYKSGISEGEGLISGGMHSDELYYLLGLCYLKDGNYQRSSDNFEAVIKEFSGSRLKEESMLGLGDTYLLREDFDKARETFRGIIKTYPHTRLKAQIYYRLSEIGFKNGDTAQGQDYLFKLRENYPLTPEVRQNQGICPGGKNNFNFYYSVQLGSFSNPENAGNLSRKLLRDGYPAYIEESSSLAGSKTYRVRVGKLKSRQEAEDLNKRLSREGYPTRICP